MISASAELTPRSARERIAAPLLRLGLRLALKPRLSPDFPLAAQRRRFARLGRLSWPRRAAAAPATIAGVPGEWLGTPRAECLRLQRRTGGAILYLHGGAYCVGSAATHRRVTACLARATAMPVFAADYRLAPEHPYPAAVEDAVTVARALAAQGPLVIMGDSAGAALALAAARAVPAAVALVLFSPWIELTAAYPPSARDVALSGEWLTACARHYLAGATVPSWLDADLAGLPPTLIQAGGDEILRDDAIRLHDALQRQGVAVRCEIVPARWHAFQLFAGWLPSADAALARAAAFIAAAFAAQNGAS